MEKVISMESVSNISCWKKKTNVKMKFQGSNQEARKINHGGREEIKSVNGPRKIPEQQQKKNNSNRSISWEKRTKRLSWNYMKGAQFLI